MRGLGKEPAALKFSIALAPWSDSAQVGLASSKSPQVSGGRSSVTEHKLMTHRAGVPSPQKITYKGHRMSPRHPDLFLLLHHSFPVSQHTTLGSWSISHRPLEDYHNMYLTYISPSHKRIVLSTRNTDLHIFSSLSICNY